MSRMFSFALVTAVLQQLQRYQPSEPLRDHTFDVQFLQGLRWATAAARDGVTTSLPDPAAPTVREMLDILDNIDLFIDVASVGADERDGPAPHLLLPAVTTALRELLGQWQLSVNG